MGNEHQGRKLYELLLELSGLDAELVERELKPLMKKLGITPDTLTTDTMRLLMTTLLDELHAEMTSDGGNASDSKNSDAMLPQA